MGHKVILSGGWAREQAKRLIDAAPAGSRVTVAAPARTVPQNDRMWAMLSDVALHKPEGRVWPPEVWKSAFMAALGHEVLWQPGIDGGMPFPAGFRTSKLSKDQMGDLITLISEYGDRHGVRWSAVE